MNPFRSGSLVVLLVALGLAEGLIQPMPLENVELTPGSPFWKSLTLNTEYMLALEPDRLLWTFRKNAGLPTPNQPFAQSWEDPNCEVRGQFLGHYLSACATLARQTGNQEIEKRSAFLVSELKKVQEKLGHGYLSAFPEEHFDRLQALQGVWAPYYVIHKIMAGLLDQHRFLGNQDALEMVKAEAQYFAARINKTLEVNGTEHWHQMLNVEFGGMMESLYILHGITKDPDHLRLAQLFTKPNFYEPLLAGKDPLPGFHANTHLAQANGFAAGWEHAGDQDKLHASSTFYDILTLNHSYTSGGSNNGEFWGPPLQVADAVTGGHGTETQETCTTYNILKLARYLFTWTGDSRFFDFYEHAMMNGIIGTQRIPTQAPSSAALQREEALVSIDEPSSAAEVGAGVAAEQAAAGVASRHLLTDGDDTQSLAELDFDPYSNDWRAAAFRMFGGQPASNDAPGSNKPGPGVIVYLTPQGTGNAKGDNSHGWGTPFGAFWCCYGSTVESYAKLADSIYFFNEPEDEGSYPQLYVNQFAPSSLDWKEKSLKLELDVHFFRPDRVAMARLAITGAIGSSDSDTEGVKAEIKLRIPAWAKADGIQVLLNGRDWTRCAGADVASQAPTPGTYCSIEDSWREGDVVEVVLPMRVTTEKIQDNRPQFANLQSIMMGPFLMAGLTNDTRTIAASPGEIEGLLQDTHSSGLVSLQLAARDGFRQGEETSQRWLQHSSDAVTLVKAGDASPADLSSAFHLVFVPANNRDALQPFPGHSTHAAHVDGRVLVESSIQPGSVLVYNDQAKAWRMATLQELPGLDSWQAVAFEVEQEPGQSQKALRPSASCSLDDGRLLCQHALPAAIASHRLDIRQPLARYPEGSQVIKTAQRSWILSPIGNIIEEKYTSYFEFQTPTSHVLS